MSRRASILHLQMGQEVIYLLLTFSLLCNVLLMHFLSAASKPPPTGGDLAAARAEAAKMRGAYERMQRENARLREELERIKQITRNDQPPIITLTEARGFSFPPASAEITPEFRTLLRREADKLKDLAKRYDASIVEVVGHTDGVVISARLRAGSNLDEALGPYATGMEATNASPTDPPSIGPRRLIPFDNVGLGMSRAVTVVRELRASGLPDHIHIQPLSAAYLIAPDDTLSPADTKVDDSARRRIEIRLRRAGPSRSN